MKKNKKKRTNKKFQKTGHRLPKIEVKPNVRRSQTRLPQIINESPNVSSRKVRKKLVKRL